MSMGLLEMIQSASPSPSSRVGRQQMVDQTNSSKSEILLELTRPTHVPMPHTHVLPRSEHQSSIDSSHARVETPEIVSDSFVKLPPLFQRNSVRYALNNDSTRPIDSILCCISARKLIRSLLANFLEEGDARLKTEIDLYQHALDAELTISDATVSEVSSMIPTLLKLSLAKCTNVTDAGLWYVTQCVICDILVPTCWDYVAGQLLVIVQIYES